MFEKILVAVDGSACSINAANTAGDLARKMGSTDVYLVVAYDPIPSYLGEPNLQSIIDARLDNAEQIVEEGLKGLGHLTAKVHTEVMEGPAADAILEVAKVREVDLVVLGSRGHGKLAALILGSTTDKGVRQANCAVIVVR